MCIRKPIPLPGMLYRHRWERFMDIYPTVLSVAGVKAAKGHVLDGADLKKLVSGKKDKRHRDDFLMHFPHEHRGSYFTSYRKGDWKLIYYYNPQSPAHPAYKLFNLVNDPYEKHDLAKTEQKKAKELFEKMVKRLETERALYPVDGNEHVLRPLFIPE